MERKEIKRYLKTIQENENGSRSVNVSIRDYTELGYLIDGLIQVCQESMYMAGCYGNKGVFDLIPYSNVLEFTRKLIPHEELELLTELQNEMSKESK